MRCTWCERLATVYVEAACIPPCCDALACRKASNEVNHALWDWRDVAGADAGQPIYPGATLDASDAALRDAPIDWSRPVEGWLLF